MLRLHKGYLLASVLLLIVEILIAAFFHDRFIRPYFGDFLVVILMYTSVKSLLNLDNRKVAIGVLLFAYLIEFLQLWGLLYKLGWDDSLTARLILGIGFEWLDMLMYTMGVATIFAIDTSLTRKT
jgi:hypothetical protein